MQAYVQQVLADTALSPAELKKTYVDEVSYDFSWVWSAQENEPLGYIGDHYERLRAQIIAVEQDGTESALYHVTGKTKVKNNVCPFTGTIRVRHVRAWRHPMAGLDSADRATLVGRGVVVADCELREEKSGPHTGVFTGVLVCSWTLPHNELKVRPDGMGDEGGDAGPFVNNAFVGEWRSYNGKLRERVRWGEGKIPDAGPLDIGAGDFMPAPEYERYGWKSYAEAMRGTDEKLWEQERAEW